jgi:hypothetical protein
MGRGGQESNLLYGDIGSTIISGSSAQMFIGKELGFDFISFDCAEDGIKREDLELNQLLIDFNQTTNSAITGYHNPIDKARWSGTEKWLIRRDKFLAGSPGNRQLSLWQEAFLKQAVNHNTSRDYRLSDANLAGLLFFIEQVSNKLISMKSAKSSSQQKIDYRSFMEPVLFNYVNKNNLLNNQAVYYPIDKNSKLAIQSRSEVKPVNVLALAAVEKGIEPIIGSWYCLVNSSETDSRYDLANQCLFFLSKKGKLLGCVPPAKDQ